MKRRYPRWLLAAAIIATFQFKSFATGSYLLVKIGDEGNVDGVPEPNIPLTPGKPGQDGVDYAPTHKSITNPGSSRSESCTIQNKCVKVYDPDRSKAKMDEGMTGRGSRFWLNYSCCYRYYFRYYYHCDFSGYYCNLVG